MTDRVILFVLFILGILFICLILLISYVSDIEHSLSEFKAETGINIEMLNDKQSALEHRTVQTENDLKLLKSQVDFFIKGGWK